MALMYLDNGFNTMKPPIPKNTTLKAVLSSSKPMYVCAAIYGPNNCSAPASAFLYMTQMFYNESGAGSGEVWCPNCMPLTEVHIGLQNMSHYKYVVADAPYNCHNGLGCSNIQSGEVAAVLVDSDGSISIPEVWYCAMHIHSAFSQWPIPPIEYFSNNAAEMVAEMGKPIPQICLKCEVPFCEVCKKCENTSCKLAGYAIATAAQLAGIRHLLAQTQKARGMAAIDGVLEIPKPYAIIMEESDIESAISKMPKSMPAFARPCPIRPRHGYIESRPVEMDSNAVEKLKALFQEVKADDPQGEVMLLPFIDAKYNLVITPTRLAIGKGHDGATAGKDCLTFPLMGVPFSEISDTVLIKAGVAKDQDPYIEAVVTKDRSTYFTQLRAGAKIPASVGADFVPYNQEVLEVIEPSMDLLEFEKQVQNLPRGTVVVKLGGTLISHYGVHCLYNNVPCFTSRIPAVGEMLAVTPRAPLPDPKAVVRGIGKGIAIPMGWDSNMDKPDRYIITMATILHNSGAMSENDGEWLGIAAAIMMRTGMAASHGEARHALKAGVNRHYIHQMAFKDYFTARKNLGKAQYLFQTYPWRTGYGGKKWADCTDSILKLDEAMKELIANPTNENVAAIVGALNHAVTRAHNNGWWLNKFVQQYKFDNAADQSLATLCDSATVLYHIHNSNMDIDGAVLELQEATPIVIEVVDRGEVLVGSKDDIDLDDTEDDDSGSDSDDDGDPDESEEVVITPNTNVMGTVPFVGLDLVTDVQIKFVTDKVSGKGFIHGQYKTDASIGYYSFDIPLHLDKMLDYPKELATCKSWAADSQSNTYIKMDVDLFKAPIWHVSHKDLPFIIKLAHNMYPKLEWNDEQKAEETSATAEEFYDDEAPF